MYPCGPALTRSGEAIFEFGLVLLPRLAIDSRGRVTLQGVEAVP